MRVLKMEEISSVSGGSQIVCTVGTSGINCTASGEYWEAVFTDFYDGLVEAFVDFYEWIGVPVPDDQP